MHLPSNGKPDNAFVSQTLQPLNSGFTTFVSIHPYTSCTMSKILSNHGSTYRDTPDLFLTALDYCTILEALITKLIIHRLSLKRYIGQTPSALALLSRLSSMQQPSSRSIGYSVPSIQSNPEAHHHFTKSLTTQSFGTQKAVISLLSQYSKHC